MGLVVHQIEFKVRKLRVGIEQPSESGNPEP